SLLERRNFVGGEDETEIRSQIIDLLQRRKAHCHASPASRFGRQTRKATRSPRRPRMASMPYRWSRRVTLRCETRKLSPRRHRLRENPFAPHVFTYEGRGLCLSADGLVNQSSAFFYAGQPK